MSKTLMSVAITGSRDVLGNLAEIAEAEATDISTEVCQAIRSVSNVQLLASPKASQSDSGSPGRTCIFGLDDESLGKVTRLTMSLPLSQAEIVRRAITAHIQRKLVDEVEEHALKLATQRERSERLVDRILEKKY